MAYAHVAHDCHVGNHTIFGNAATLGGHVTVEDFATISAFSGVHQFCRVGEHAFIGGYTVVTRDALPYAKTVGNRARIYGVNTIGLIAPRASVGGHAQQAEARLPVPARVAAQHEPRARADRAGRRRSRARRSPTWSTSSAPRQRGVILRRATRRTEEMVATSSLQSRLRSSAGDPSRCHASRPHRRQRPFPFLVLDAARAAGPRRHGRRDQGRGVSRAADAAAREPRARRCTGCRSASSASASTSLKDAGVTQRRDGRPGQARQDLLAASCPT